MAGRQPTPPELIVGACVAGLFIVCAMVVALAFADSATFDSGTIITAVLGIIMNFAIQALTLFKVDQTQKRTEELKEKIEGNGDHTLQA